MRQAKPGVVFVAAIVALMGIGFGYAHWTETITVEGTVTTGNLELVPTCEIEKLAPDGPYGEVDCEIEGDTVTYRISNAFPCMKVRVNFSLANTGSIPAGLYKIAFSDSEEHSWEHTAPDIPEDMGPVIKGGLPGWIEVESINWGGAPFGQIDPGQEAWVEIIIHFTEDTPEGSTYTFSFTLEYWNWNEVPTGPS